MSHREQIDSIISRQFLPDIDAAADTVYLYAGAIAEIEKCVVVVSDLKSCTSRIFNGAFSQILGLTGNTLEDSIWEKEILSKMSAREQEEKYLAELRFYNFLRRMPRRKRSDYYLVTLLKFDDCRGGTIDVLHRMYYRYDDQWDAIRFAICVYGPATLAIPAKSAAVDSVTGKWEELLSADDSRILPSREKQVLTLIDKGLTSKVIADRLCISRNTVSRHRQEILAKLHVKNSTEACQRAKHMHII